MSVIKTQTGTDMNLKGELLMKKLKTFASQIWNDESAQGTAEYILLLVAIIAIAMIFKNQIKEAVTSKMESVKSDVVNFGSGN